MGKPTICMCENKGADQLRGNREADQRLCFRYTDSTIPLLLKSEISSFYLVLRLYRPVCVGPVRKPHCWFSHETAQMTKTILLLHVSLCAYNTETHSNVTSFDDTFDFIDDDNDNDDDDDDDDGDDDDNDTGFRMKHD